MNINTAYNFINLSRVLRKYLSSFYHHEPPNLVRLYLCLQLLSLGLQCFNFSLQLHHTTVLLKLSFTTPGFNFQQTQVTQNT